MAKANPVVLQPQAPEVKPVGPEIVFFGEGAEEVVFTINPLAVKYEVHAHGLVREYLG